MPGMSPAESQPLHTTEAKLEVPLSSCERKLPEVHEHMPAIGKILEDGYGLEA